MKREDLELRAAARAGDSRAALEMARRLFDGAPGLPRNPKLGLAYLQQELANDNVVARELVAAHVPLEVLASQQLLDLLRRQAARGCTASIAKIAAWEFFALSCGCEPADVARTLAGLPRELLDAYEAARVAAEHALAESRPQDAAHCLQVAAQLGDKERLAPLVWKLLCAPARTDEAPLPASLVQASLRTLAEQGHPEAQLALGRALAARRPDRDRAMGWLLRAADNGMNAAWMDLYQLLGVGHAARFYLRKGAMCGVAAAQLELGKLLLCEADSLDDAEDAVQWLALASDAGLDRARALMETLVIALPPIAAEDETERLRQIAAIDRDIGMRCELARAFHLTRHESLALAAPRDLRSWGLVLHGSANENPKGRVAPAVNVSMVTALTRAREFYSADSPLAGSLVLQRGRLQRKIFSLLGIAEPEFFAPPAGRSLKQPGYGRHWVASRSMPAAMPAP